MKDKTQMVLMRSEDADPQERYFTPEHAEALIKLEASRDITNWVKIDKPSGNNSDGTSNE